MRGLEKFLLISGAIVVVATLTVRGLHPGSRATEMAALQSVFPRADSFVARSEPFHHYQARAFDWRTGQSEPVGYCFDTANAAPRVKGFGGPIHILLGVDLCGTIVGMTVLEHNETPAYVTGLTGQAFTGQFIGKGPDAPLEIGQDLDGLSGATVTSRGAARAVREGLAAAAVLFPQAPGTICRPGSMTAWRWLKTVALVVLLGLCLVAFWRKKRALRPLTLALGLLLVGFVLNGSLSVVHLVNILSLRFPPASELLTWYLVVLFGVLTALFLGRLYCGWICPFGALQELLKKAVPYRIRPSGPVHRAARRLRTILLWLVICLTLLTGSQELLGYEPFGTVFGLKGSALMWAIVIVTLGASLVIDRFWCRYFCVVGAALHFLGRLGLRRKRHRSPEGAAIRGDF